MIYTSLKECCCECKEADLQLDTDIIHSDVDKCLVTSTVECSHCKVCQEYNRDEKKGLYPLKDLFKRQTQSVEQEAYCRLVKAFTSSEEDLASAVEDVIGILAERLE